MAQTTDSHRACGDAFFTAGDWRAAVDALLQAIAVEPRAADLLVKLGRAYLNLGQTSEAARYLKLAHQTEPMSSHTLSHLAVAVSLSEGRSAALQYFAKAAELAPADANMLNNYGQALLALDRVGEAEAVFRQALQHDPKHVQALTGLASIMAPHDRNQAERLLRQALQIQPDYPEALLQLGYLFLRAGHAIKALGFFERIPPMAGDTRPLVNAANALALLSRFNEMKQYFGRALQIEPHNSTIWSIALLSTTYDPNVNRDDLFQRHLDFGNIFSKGPITSKATSRPAANAAKKIKLGYVSGDFRAHVCSWFLLPLLQAHDRINFDIVCYSTDVREDQITTRFRSIADLWRPISVLSDEAAAHQMALDEIDVLIDCSGHSQGNRLSLFAKKPAPISVTFLGSPGTTGLNSISYRFTDSVTDPIGEGNAYSTEKLVRLPNGFLAYQPTIEMPDVSPVPCLRKGMITFASFNNRLKLNDSVIELWAKVLAAVPGSKLILKDRCFSFAAMADDMRQRFQSHGITPDRLDIRPYNASVLDHYLTFSEVDIALDPFPFNGGTTTCDAIYMGVPVISLLGDRYISRMAATIMSRCGLEELVAKSQADFIDIAVRLANNSRKLQHLRQNLRKMFESSPLGNPEIVVRDMERFYTAVVRDEKPPFVEA